MMPPWFPLSAIAIVLASGAAGIVASIRVSRQKRHQASAFRTKEAEREEQCRRTCGRLTWNRPGRLRCR